MRCPLPFVVLAVLVAAPAAAQEAAEPVGACSQQAEEEGGEHANEVALIVAGTRDRAEGKTSFTIGAEYERRLTSRLGIVTEFEFVQGPDSLVFAAPFVYRMVRNLRLFIGPGFERRPLRDEGGDAGGETGGETTGHTSMFLWRTGFGYTFELAERYSLGPTAYLDVIREEAGEWNRAFVFGVSLGVGF